MEFTTVISELAKAINSLQLLHYISEHNVIIVAPHYLSLS